jgi:hypothetical protein
LLLINTAKRKNLLEIIDRCNTGSAPSLDKVMNRIRVSFGAKVVIPLIRAPRVKILPEVCIALGIEKTA